MPLRARAMRPVNRGVARHREATAVPPISAAASAQLTPTVYENGLARVSCSNRTSGKPGSRPNGSHERHGLTAEALVAKE